MNSRMKDLLPQDILNVFASVQSLRRSNAEWQYSFLDDGEFKNIELIPKASSIYWTEMLQRIHVVVLVSCFRTLRWLEAVDNNSGNYYGFCSTLRGLIESISDTFYTLKKVPLTIARDYKAIKEQIYEASPIITTHQSLEEELLHYIQASKFRTAEIPGSKNVFIAKQISEYIAAIDDEEGNMKRLYDLLCGVAHPAYESNQVFIFGYEGRTIVCSDSFEFEEKMIDALVESNYLTLQNSFRVYFNNIISIFLLINTFEIDSLKTVVTSEAEFKSGKVWGEIQDAIQDSVQRFYSAMKTGYYE